MGLIPRSPSENSPIKGSGLRLFFPHEDANMINLFPIGGDEAGAIPLLSIPTTHMTPDNFYDMWATTVQSSIYTRPAGPQPTTH